MIRSDAAPEVVPSAPPLSCRPVMRVLLATDGSSRAGAASRFLQRLELLPRTAIQVLTVLDHYSDRMPEEAREGMAAAALRMVDDAAGQVSRPGVQVTHQLRIGSPAHQIIEAAAEFEADLVLIGAHGHSRLHDLFMGSTALNVARHCPLPVLVGREVRDDLRQVVLAVDQSEHARQALDFASGIPLPAGARITLVNVVPSPSLLPVTGVDPVPDYAEILLAVRKDARDKGEELLQSAGARLEQDGRTVRLELRGGDPAVEILKLVEELKADLVIAGARGLSPIQALLLGSVADRLLHHAPCSVALVR